MVETVIHTFKMTTATESALWCAHQKSLLIKLSLETSTASTSRHLDDIEVIRDLSLVKGVYRVAH